MKKEEFKNRLEEIYTSNIVESLTEPKHQPIVIFLKELLNKNLISLRISNEEMCKIISDSIVDGKHDNGIDALYLDKNSKSVYVIQSKTIQSQSAENKSGFFEFHDNNSDNDFKHFSSSFENLVNAIRNGDESYATKNSLLSKRVDEISKYQSEINQNLLFKGIYLITRDVNDMRPYHKKSKIEIVGIRELSEKLSSIKSFDGKVSEIILSGAKQEGMKHEVFLDPSDETKKVQILNFVMSIKSFKDSISSHNYSSLLEENIRFEYSKSIVNEDIKKTLTDPIKIKFFILYNNGITIQCSNAKSEGTPNGTFRFILSNASIINGGQTAKIIMDNNLPKNEQGEVVDGEIRISVIATSEVDSAQLSTEIANNLNNQNPISPSFKLANDINAKRFKEDISRKYSNYRIIIKENEQHVEKKRISDVKLEKFIIICIICLKKDISYDMKNGKNKLYSTETYMNTFNEIIKKDLTTENFDLFYVKRYEFIEKFIKNVRSQRNFELTNLIYKDVIKYSYINTSINLLLFASSILNKEYSDKNYEKDLIELSNLLFENIPDLNPNGDENKIKTLSKTTQNKEVWARVRNFLEALNHEKKPSS